MNTTSILNPDSDVVLSDNKSVTVKQLTWKKTFVFFEKLQGQIKGLFNEKGELAPDISKVMDAIKANKEVVDWLVHECTGKEAEFLDELPLGDMMKLVSKALEINLLAIAEQIKNVKGRLAALGGSATGQVGDQPNASKVKPLLSAT